MLSLLGSSPRLNHRLKYAIFVITRVFLLYLTVKLFSVSGGPSSTAIYSTTDTLLKLVSAPISLSALGYGVVVLTKLNSNNQAFAIRRYLLSTAYLSSYLPLLLSLFGSLLWNSYVIYKGFPVYASIYINIIIFIIPSALVLGIRINSRLQSEGQINLLALCQSLSIFLSLVIIYSQITRAYPDFFLP